MKKIIFVLAFAGVGLFANASNGKIKSVSTELRTFTSKTSRWMIVYHCWSGDITVSGFDTYAQANAYLQNHGVNTICP